MNGLGLNTMLEYNAVHIQQYIDIVKTKMNKKYYKPGVSSISMKCSSSGTESSSGSSNKPMTDSRSGGL